MVSGATAHISGEPTSADPTIARRPATLPGLLLDAADRHPDTPAVITPTERITYRQLLHEARAVAGYVTGWSTDERIAVLARNSPAFVVALAGILMAGRVAVLVNSLGTPSDIDVMLQTADCRRLLTTSRLGDTSELAMSLGRDVGFIDDVIRKNALTGVGLPMSQPTDEAVVIFTSGTTGRSKGIVHAHRTLAIQSLRWAGLHGLTPGEKVFSTAPMFWSSGLTKSLGAVVSSGASLVTMPRFEPGVTLSLLASEQVDTIILPPHLDRRLVEHPAFAQTDLTSLRRSHRRNPTRGRLGLTEEWNPGGYGLSEMCTLVASYPARTAPAELDGSCGPVVSGAEIRIADLSTGRTVERGVTGRIFVGGETLMRRYLNADAEYDEHGLLGTNDLGHLDDRGRLYFDGRIDAMVKSAGVNVSPLEVEAAVAGYARLTSTAVVALPHPTLGTALVLCATPADDRVTEGDVARYLGERLARYKLPRRVVLVRGPSLPLTVTQKVDLGRARELAARALLDDADEDWRATLRDAFPSLPAGPR